MKLQLQPILESLDLGDYHEPYRGTFIRVWINPTRTFLDERTRWLDEYSARWTAIQLQYDVGDAVQPKPTEIAAAAAAVNEFNEWVRTTFAPALNEWFARLFSQGPEDTRWTAEELAEIDQQDQALLIWMKRRANDLIEAHRTGQKKG